MALGGTTGGDTSDRSSATSPSGVSLFSPRQTEAPKSHTEATTVASGKETATVPATATVDGANTSSVSESDNDRPKKKRNSRRYVVITRRCHVSALQSDNFARAAGVLCVRRGAEGWCYCHAGTFASVKNAARSSSRSLRLNSMFSQVVTV